MFNILKRLTEPKDVICPHCLTEQKAPARAFSVYCKNCKSRIETTPAKKQDPAARSLDASASQKTSRKTKNISCPFCHTVQDIMPGAVSAYCKNCSKRIQINQDSETVAIHPVLSDPQKDVSCPGCNFRQTVPSTALSCFCSECGNRINLQNYAIHGRFRGDIETKGSVYISSDGSVEGNINTGILSIAGRFNGEAVAEEKIILHSSAKLKGKIRAPVLEAESGAVFKGHLHIG